METQSRVLDYIRSNWPRSFCRDADGSGFCGDDLTYPYTAPCVKGEGHFSFSGGFIEVVVQMLMTDRPLKGATKPALEQRNR